jgi:hypothetical protein
VAAPSEQSGFLGRDAIGPIAESVALFSRPLKNKTANLMTPLFERIMSFR